MTIPRAVLYHSFWFDVSNYLSLLFGINKPLPDDTKRIEEFERAFAVHLGAAHSVAFPFARMALYFALKSQRFDSGSEIIMPPITIKPMMDIILNLGMKPVFVDIERETLCFDPDQLQKSITPNTKAILITYLYGIVPDVKRLMSICSNHGLFVVEDISHNLNAKFEGHSLGTFGDVGIYSSSITKTLDTYGGGIAITNDGDLQAALKREQGSLNPTPIKRLRAKVKASLVWNFATRRWIFCMFVSPMLRFLAMVNPQLQQRLMGARIGLQAEAELPESYFEQFTSFQASMGLLLLPKIDAEDSRRIANAIELQESLAAHGFCHAQVLEAAKNVYWQFVVFPEDRSEYERVMSRYKVDTGTTNLSLICSLGLYPAYERDCPNAYFVKHNAMYVPVYPRLSRRDLTRVKNAVRAAVSKGG